MDKKLNNQKGFTLAELLIVVAIIAVLVAIGIPVFAGQLEKSRESVDLSDIRSAYSEVMMAAITGDTSAVYTKDPNQTIYKANGIYSITVSPLKQKQDGWQTASNLTIGGVSSNSGNPYWIGVPTSEGTCIVAYHESEEYVSFEWSGTSSEGGNSNGGNAGNGGNGSTTIMPTPSVTPEPSPTEKPSAPIISNVSIGGNDYIATEIPEEPQLFNVIKGNIYIYNGELYVALNTESNIGRRPLVRAENTFDYLYSKLDLNDKVRTEADLEKENEWQNAKDVLKNLSEGTLYKDGDDLYVYKYSSQGSVNAQPPTGNWQIINK